MKGKLDFGKEKKSSLSVWLEKEEVGWMLEQLKAAMELKPKLHFIRKLRCKTRTRTQEIGFNSKGRFIKILEVVAKRNCSFMFVPKGQGSN